MHAQLSVWLSFGPSQTTHSKYPEMTILFVYVYLFCCLRVNDFNKFIQQVHTVPYLSNAKRTSSNIAAKVKHRKWKDKRGFKFTCVQTPSTSTSSFPPLSPPPSFSPPCWSSCQALANISYTREKNNILKFAWREIYPQSLVPFQRQVHVFHPVGTSCRRAPFCINKDKTVTCTDNLE